MYDVIIIGAGPAGMAAAIYAGRASLMQHCLKKNLLEARLQKLMK